MKRVNQFKTQPSIPLVEPKQQQPEPTTVVTSLTIPGKNYWNLLREHEKLALAFGIGLFIGLVVLGWWIWPVEWTGATYTHLTPEDKGVLVQIASDLNAYDQNSPAVQQLRQKWPELDQLACFVVQNQPVAEDEKIRLVSLAYKINQRGCE
jgi:hypothetical protein